MENKARKCKTCFIPACRYGCVDESQVHFFRSGLKRLSSWQAAIEKRGLKPGSRICASHFLESEILKGRDIHGTFYPCARWRLKYDAVPTLNLGKFNVHSLVFHEIIVLRCFITTGPAQENSLDCATRDTENSLPCKPESVPRCFPTASSFSR